MKHIKLSVLLFVLISAVNIFASGGKRNGTAGAGYLLIPVGARGVAMGGSTLVNSVGVESMYWNPANLARSESSTSILVSHMTYIADINVEYGALGIKVGELGYIGLDVKALKGGDILITDYLNPDGTGATYNPAFTVIGLTYARELNDRIAVGVTLNYINETIDRVSATGISFNAGVSYINFANIDGLSFAVTMKNQGPEMKFEGSGLRIDATADELKRGKQSYLVDAASFELPSSLEFGVGYKYALDTQNEVNVSGVFQNNNFWSDEYKIGAEYGFDNMFFARVGYDFAPDVDDEEHIYGFAAGFGINYESNGFAAKFDYAYRQTEVFDGNHVFSILLGL